MHPQWSLLQAGPIPFSPAAAKTGLSILLNTVAQVYALLEQASVMVLPFLKIHSRPPKLAKDATEKGKEKHTVQPKAMGPTGILKIISLRE